MDLTASGPWNRRGSRAAISSCGRAKRSQPARPQRPPRGGGAYRLPRTRVGRPECPSRLDGGGRGKPYSARATGRRTRSAPTFGGRPVWLVAQRHSPFIIQLLECVEGRGKLPAEGDRSQRHWIKQLPGTELVRMGWWCRELQRGLGVWRWWVRIAQCEGTASRECFLELWRFEACSGPRFPRFSVEAE